MKTTVALLGLLCCGSSAAQQMHCPASVPMGHPLCVPVGSAPSNLPAEAPPRSPVTITFPRFGGIAVDHISGDNAISENKSFEEEAAKKAMALCINGRKKHACKLLLTFGNQCAALAWPEGTRPAPPKANVGLTTEQAEKLALAECRVKGGACKVIYSGCAHPVTKRYE